MQKLTSTPLNTAMKLTLDLVEKKPLKQWISISAALGRVLASDIVCQKNLPSFDNSALDGYAIKYGGAEEELHIKDTIFAGDSKDDDLDIGECFKIMTGAKIPKSADTIVAFEDAQLLKDGLVQIPKKIKKGNAFRVKGEELAEGKTLFEKGTFINSSVLAMLASQGISQIQVYKKISLGVFSTGDELKEPWESANDDEIYNVNSTSLIALFGEHGFEADYCGVIPDNLEESKRYFSEMKKYDVLVTTGGISMGEADFVEDALLHNGLKPLFHGLNIKPGRPTMIGKMDSTIVASMPGNPLAAYVNAFLILVPLLKKLQGFLEFEHKVLKAKMAKELQLKANRTNLVLGSYEDGKFFVTAENRYGSGMILPMVQSNVLLVVPDDKNFLSQDEEINLIVFKGTF